MTADDDRRPESDPGLERWVLHMEARLMALDMVCRALFADRMKQYAAPRAAAFRYVEQMIASMHGNAPPESESEAFLYGMIEDALRAFLANVDARLKGRGHER